MIDSLNLQTTKKKNHLSLRTWLLESAIHLSGASTSFVQTLGDLSIYLQAFALLTAIHKTSPLVK